MARMKVVKNRINYLNIWAVKADNRETIANICHQNLYGLRFDQIYTPDYGLCMETVIQICRSNELGEVEITLTERFRDVQFIQGSWGEIKDAKFKDTVALWKKKNPKNFKALQLKITESIRTTTLGLIRKFNNRLAFNILVIVDDTTPIFELTGLPVNDLLGIMKPGEITRIRIQISGDENLDKCVTTPIHAIQMSR